MNAKMVWIMVLVPNVVKTKSVGFNMVSITSITVFENRPKNRIQHGERSELRLHFELPKID